MTVFDFLTLIFGIALFLFGMNLMGESLRKSAGRRLKLFLGKLTSNTWKGLLLGIVVTAVIQSSSATTVMIVGFVNSGTMALSQAVAVIMGANVGTAITSWITALSGLENGGAVGTVLQWFKPSVFTPILAFLGLLFYMVGKNDRKKNLGTILLGFSVLMIGMDTMSDAVYGLRSNEAFRSILLLFENPILGLLAGMVLTAIIQSSSASIGILQSLTATGAITFGNAVPIIMGQNIGTCITAFISSIGTTKNAKRAAYIHLFFNVIGSAVCMLLFVVLKYAIGLSVLQGSIDMWGIAILHTLFNLITVLVLFPFCGKLEKLSALAVRKNREENVSAAPDERLLVTPSVALSHSVGVTVEMARIATEACALACDLLREYSGNKAIRVRKAEVAVDEYEDRLGTYLLRISEANLLSQESREVNRLLHLLGDFERISDHAVNLMEEAEELTEKKLSFPSEVWEELSILIAAVKEITWLAAEALENDDADLAGMVEPLEQVIDQLREELKRRQILRLRNNQLSMELGFILSDILTDLARIADHCSNVAGALMEFSQSNTAQIHHRLQEYRKDKIVFEVRYGVFFNQYRLPDLSQEK